MSNRFERLKLLVQFPKIVTFVVTIVFSISITLAIPRMSQSLPFINKVNFKYYAPDSAITTVFGSETKSILLTDNIPVPYISRSFSKPELEKIVRSLFFLNGILQPNSAVRPCIERYAKSDLVTTKPVTVAVGLVSRPDNVTPNGSVSAFWSNWSIAAYGRKTQITNIDKKRVYIEKYYEESNEMGHANLGLNWRHNDSSPEPFRIFLNAYNLNKDRSYTDKAGNSISNMTVWAEIIFHELLHNMGYTHADVSDSFQPVVGNFVYEAGWCVKRAGRDRPPGDFGLISSGDSDRLFVDNVRRK